MSLLQIVLRSLRQHMLSTVITAFSIALASGLLMSVWVVKDQARENFTGVDSGFDGVFGARGSKLQLVLNSIFHLEASPGNLTWSSTNSSPKTVVLRAQFQSRSGTITTATASLA